MTPAPWCVTIIDVGILMRLREYAEAMPLALVLTT
jgi:hypothetical protein